MAGLQRSKTVCCVVGCSNSQAKNESISMYSFPNETMHKKRRQQWIQAVKRTAADGRPWEPSKYSRICSDHFVGGKKIDVHDSPSYLPTLFPKVYKKDANAVIRSARRYERLQMRRTTANTASLDVTPNEELSPPSSSPGPHSVSVSIQTEPWVDSDEEQESINTMYCWQGVNDASTQVNMSQPQRGPSCVKRKISMVDIGCGPNIPLEDNVPKTEGFMGFKNIANEAQISQLAGVSFAVFTMLLSYIQPDGQNANPTSFRKVSRHNRLLMSLMKLKLGLTYDSLACIFSVSSRTVSSIFYQTIETLLKNTSNWIYWPSQFAVRQTLPTTFSDYPNCRAIIDCTELRTETPPTIEQRVCQYSQYKGWYTVKFLIATTPAGQISFVSKAYGGRSTDGHITVDSGFINLVQPGDLIMADKGFPQITTEIEKQDAVLVMPPFLRDTQFTGEQVDETYRVASVRIHVERCIQRVKTYKILDLITVDLLPNIDAIFRMCCILANLKPPLIADGNSDVRVE